MSIPASPTFNDYRKILRKRANVIVLFVLVGLAGGFFFKQSVVSLYTAVAKISIVPPAAALGKDGLLASTSFNEVLFGQYEELRSRSLAEKVADEMGWAKEKSAAVRRIMSAVTISSLSEPGRPEALSGIVAVKAADPNPRVAMDIANTLAEIFISLKQKERETLGKKVYDELVERVKKAKDVLDESESALLDFRKQNGLNNTSSQYVTGEAVENIKSEIIRMQKERSEKEGVLATLEKLAKEDIIQALTFVAEKLGNVFTINVGLKQKVMDKENELNAIKQVYKAKHPEMIRVKSELELFRGQVVNELSSAINSLKSDIATSLHSEEVLQSYLTRPDMGARQNQLERMQKEVKLNKDIYNEALKKMKEGGLVEYVGTSPEVKILEKALLPTQSRSSSSFPWVIFPIAGFILGLVCVLVQESMDVSVRTIEDIERFFNLSVLGEIAHEKVTVRKQRK